jgi:hypothetical protein
MVTKVRLSLLIVCDRNASFLQAVTAHCGFGRFQRNPNLCSEVMQLTWRVAASYPMGSFFQVLMMVVWLCGIQFGRSQFLSCGMHMEVVQVYNIILQRMQMG